MRLRVTGQLLHQAFLDWQRHRCATLAAALAFYAMVSSAPFLISLYLLGVATLGRDAMVETIVPQIRDRLGPKGADFIEYLSVNFSTKASWTGAMALLGYLFMAWGALQYFRHMREALEILWGRPSAKPGFLEVLRQKTLGFVLAIVFAQIYLVSLWIRAAFEIPSNAPETPLNYLVGSGDMLAFFILQVTLALLLYRFFAPARISGRGLLVGATVTGTLLTVARLVGSFVLARGTLTSFGGLAGGFVVLMIWEYFMNQVFLYGAEVTHCWTLRHESTP